MWRMNTNATFTFMTLFYNLPVDWLSCSIFSDLLFINGKQKNTVSSGWPHIYLYKNGASSYSQVDNDVKYLSLIQNCYNGN
jgi:hypothetical protein